MNNSAAIVGEIFQEAGSAFFKLSEMTMQLTSTDEHSPGGKWSDVEIGMLHDCVNRFAVELNEISQHIMNRTIEIPDVESVSAVRTPQPEPISPPPPPPLEERPYNQSDLLLFLDPSENSEDSLRCFNPEKVPSEPPNDIMQPKIPERKESLGDIEDLQNLEKISLDDELDDDEYPSKSTSARPDQPLRQYGRRDNSKKPTVNKDTREFSNVAFHINQPTNVFYNRNGTNGFRRPEAMSSAGSLPVTGETLPGYKYRSSCRTDETKPNQLSSLPAHEIFSDNSICINEICQNELNLVNLPGGSTNSPNIIVNYLKPITAESKDATPAIGVGATGFMNQPLVSGSDSESDEPALKKPRLSTDI